MNQTANAGNKYGQKNVVALTRNDERRVYETISSDKN
jgi:hypothetical protein